MLEKLNNEHTIIIFGRSNSGTRVLPSCLEASGIFMGDPLNGSSDLIPPDDLYAACRMLGQHVIYQGKHQWDFSQVHQMGIPKEFQELLECYLQSLLASEAEIKGWKIPENTLILPWLVRLLPKAKFIHWVRHPEGSCSRLTGVDRLERWGIPCKKFLIHEWNVKMRAISWKYHYDIVASTPSPKQFLRVRFEDYILDTKNTHAMIEQFLGFSFQRIELNKSKAGPYTKRYKSRFRFLRPAMDALQYD